ncbi:hypothetical protein V8F20_008553 [Naviculisporaceae sp. PSN 640]
MCILKYSDCPGCYGLHNNELIELERCMRQIHVRWALPNPMTGKAYKQDDGPCPRSLHVQYSLYESEQYATHEHIHGLVGKLEPKRHATLKFMGRLSELELNPTPQTLVAPPEEEETTGPEWIPTPTKMADYWEPDVVGNWEPDDPAGFSGPPIDFFTTPACTREAKDKQLDENRAANANPSTATKTPQPVDQPPEKIWYWPRPILFDPNPPRRRVEFDIATFDKVVEVEDNPQANPGVAPTPLARPTAEPRPPTKPKRTYKKRVVKQPPSPPGSEEVETSITVGGPVRKTSQKPTTREKKEAVRRGRPPGVKNGVNKSRYSGKQ